MIKFTKAYGMGYRAGHAKCSGYSPANPFTGKGFLEALRMVLWNMGFEDGTKESLKTYLKPKKK